MQLPQHYHPQEAEPRWQKFWQENTIFKFHEQSKRQIYSIDTPPPTMSGRMHIGHAFSYTQQDIIARQKRMLGYNVFFPFGTDDNGLPTERMVEKMKNVKAVNMERSEFIRLCVATLDELRPEFIDDWKGLGISCDFSLLYSTINDHCRTWSQWSFLDLYKKGRAYRKEAPVIWCTECRTAIAQAELQDKEKETQLVYVKVKTEEGKEIIFATTRPELYPSCAGISVHPDDERYKTIVGKTVTMPLTKTKIKITADTIVDPNFGSGVVYFCSSGDAQFLDWETRHPVQKKIYLLNRDGTMNEHAGAYKGLYVNQARKKIIEDLQNRGVIEKIEPLKHTVNAHERCGTVVEYVSSKQWFIKYLDLKEEFLAVGKTLEWHPEFMRQRYENWVKGLKWDWCISRQRFFGIPFPVWYCTKCHTEIIAEENQLPVDPLKDKPKTPCSCGNNNFEPEKDVLDTWATSSITPLIVTKLIPNNQVQLPMSLRPQAHEIISTWLFYTIAKQHLHFQQLPWTTTAISGWVLDPYGQKMSKSKGNVIAPQEIKQKFSADALRFWAASVKLGDDISYQEKDVLTGQKLVTKLWNASKLCLLHLEDYDGQDISSLEVFDQWLLSKLQTLIKQSTDGFAQYEYPKSKAEVEQFFWQTFCDQYLEIVKDRIYNPQVRGVEARRGAQTGLYHTLLTILKLMAPILPHITEEIYHNSFAFKEKKNSIHVSSWPIVQPELMNEQAELIGDMGIDIINTVRKFKSEHKLSLKEGLSELVLVSEDKEFSRMISAIIADLKAVLNVGNISFIGRTELETANFGIKVGIRK